jgi:hypothetical protein
MQSGSTPIFITHLKQIHNLNGTRFLSHTAYEKIAFSQFGTAQAILQDLKENKSIVLVEGLNQDLSPLEMSITKAEEALYIFPQGLPKNYLELNDQQKYFLVTVGGAYTLYYLNQLPNIYKTLTPEEDKEIREKLEYENLPKMLSKIYNPSGNAFYPEFDILINEKRELAALKLAEKAAIETGNPNVILVFGAAHNFEKRIKFLSNPFIVFNKNIETHESDKPSVVPKSIFSGLNSFFDKKLEDKHDIITINFLKKYNISSQDILLLVSCIAYCLIHNGLSNLNNQKRVSL